ncbi:hypothetical protein ACTWP5_25535 [Streptomyces sp. 4N509B]|uniref:hypothetical protein n=1 Tax=Streptomyces sp. 4N509B TaxID=3457413 RepID=UPI003FD31D3E
MRRTVTAARAAASAAPAPAPTARVIQRAPDPPSHAPAAPAPTPTPTPTPPPTGGSASSCATPEKPAADGGFDPRTLTARQLDELSHRLIGRITRLVRTELRLDRERIGRLRDTRY